MNESRPAPQGGALPIGIRALIVFTVLSNLSLIAGCVWAVLWAWKTGL